MLFGTPVALPFDVSPSGIRFKTGVYLDLTTTDSVTIGYTG